MIDKKIDGVDHINIYSKGNTELGRLLSNFAHTPVKLKDGNFECLEGYWYWLLSDKDIKAEPLRKLIGWEAKQYGRNLKIRDFPYSHEIFEFRDNFINAVHSKVEQHPEIAEMLKESELPFEHYYVYNDKTVQVRGCGWMLDVFYDLRKKLQNGE